MIRVGLAFIGGWLAGLLGINVGGGLIASIITAVVGAIIGPSNMRETWRPMGTQNVSNPRRPQVEGL